MTPNGQHPVETLRVGDLVVTKDNGPQPIRWTGNKYVPGHGHLAPILLKRGAIGNTRDLLVSPQHRVLVKGNATQIHHGECEMLAPTQHLVNHRNILRQNIEIVGYFHILFERHEIIFAENAKAESFHPGMHGVDTLSEFSRQELYAAMPRLQSDGPADYGLSARPNLRRYEARVSGKKGLQ